MTRREHALMLHDLGLSLVRQRGRRRLVGNTSVNEYDYGVLTIRHWPNRNALDIYFAGPGAFGRAMVRHATGHSLRARNVGSRSERGGKARRVMSGCPNGKRAKAPRQVGGRGQTNSAHSRRATDCGVAGE